MRMALYELCEIFRLCEGMGTESRKMMELFRNRMLEETRSEHNLLPHETPDKTKTVLTPKNTSPLLPRFDAL